MVLAVTGIAASRDVSAVNPTNPTNIMAKAMCIPQNISRKTARDPIAPTVTGSMII